MKEFLIVGGIALAAYAAYWYFNNATINYKKGELPSNIYKPIPVPICSDFDVDKFLHPNVVNCNPNRELESALGIVKPKERRY